MSRKRVCWDGPNPSPGDYLSGRAGEVFRIDTVEPLPRPEAGGVRLVLELATMPGTFALPHGARWHPWMTTQRSDRDGPPRVRQLSSVDLPHAVMRSTWRDPTDTKPNASHRPRQQAGWRSYCPLRRMMTSGRSQIEERHVLAADRLRLSVDLATIGQSGGMSFEALQGGFGPRAGPSAAASEQARAAMEVRRTFAHFETAHLRMLVAVVLQNHSLEGWCQARDAAIGQRVSRNLEMGRLLVILDLLAKYSEAEVKEDVAADRLIGVA